MIYLGFNQDIKLLIYINNVSGIRSKLNQIKIVKFINLSIFPSKWSHLYSS